MRHCLAAYSKHQPRTDRCTAPTAELSGLYATVRTSASAMQYVFRASRCDDGTCSASRTSPLFPCDGTFLERQGGLADGLADGARATYGAEDATNLQVCEAQVLIELTLQIAITRSMRVGALTCMRQSARARNSIIPSCDASSLILFPARAGRARTGLPIDARDAGRRDGEVCSIVGVGRT